MRILHVLPFPGVGGTEIATRRIIDGVRTFGVESRALLLRPTDEQIAYFHDAGVPCTVLNPSPEPSFRHGATFLSESAQLAKTCADVDLLHCADAPAAFRVGVAGRMAGIPVLSHVRNRQVNLTWRDRFFIRSATHFAFVSKASRENFPLRVSPSRSSIVYDGMEVAPDEEIASRDAIATTVRTELGLSPDTLIAGMFARVAPQKDYESLIQAAALLRNSLPNLRFVIVGAVSGVPEVARHYEHVRRLLAQAGLEERFLFTGFRSDVHRLMLAADVCVLSTHFEGLPLVVLEAMALARPCVATSVDGVPETLIHGRTGLLYPHKDATALAACLLRVLGDKAYSDRMGREAREDVQRRFGWKRFANDMHSLYAKLVRPPTAAGRLLRQVMELPG
ncbi:glycosyltransferase family 4 protein [Roseomonas xinghualingensis]|uniref:glycosyltransferase family 4 protein n=1 Tax=Roseomonas xinghualingensis TaxID=2986475 RepID=UPI0021F24511|nr:glycosyltransferase family 4 protein [Roseomonas sp. SXEYE001]MCV4210056.1 glycosyltransferase family 4 protein [Roseomonas sp. SXEYE001]